MQNPAGFAGLVMGVKPHQKRKNRKQKPVRITNKRGMWNEILQVLVVVCDNFYPVAVFYV